MKWLSKIIVAVIVTVVIAASIALGILNPQMITINLWGWITIEHTLVIWSLMVLALGIVGGVVLASFFIIKLQRQLYLNQRKLMQLQSASHTQEIKK